ncbi:unnamed protein product [Paramecium sonneborni]|uniref:Transmembrane protein n=1 Tax=Paramecium sonneborni TaxID=65129 RepID=A0A8S1RTV4_9CILI|nr:unnamed protein product [Paramecium sonneborni]
MNTIDKIFQEHKKDIKRNHKGFNSFNIKLIIFFMSQQYHAQHVQNLVKQNIKLKFTKKIHQFFIIPTSQFEQKYKHYVQKLFQILITLRRFHILNTTLIKSSTFYNNHQYFQCILNKEILNRYSQFVNRIPLCKQYHYMYQLHFYKKLIYKDQAQSSLQNLSQPASHVEKKFHGIIKLRILYQELSSYKLFPEKQLVHAFEAAVHSGKIIYNLIATFVLHLKSKMQSKHLSLNSRRTCIIISSIFLKCCLLKSTKLEPSPSRPVLPYKNDKLHNFQCNQLNLNQVQLNKVQKNKYYYFLYILFSIKYILYMHFLQFELHLRQLASSQQQPSRRQTFCHTLCTCYIIQIKSNSAILLSVSTRKFDVRYCLVAHTQHLVFDASQNEQQNIHQLLSKNQFY